MDLFGMFKPRQAPVPPVVASEACAAPPLDLPEPPEGWCFVLAWPSSLKPGKTFWSRADKWCWVISNNGRTLSFGMGEMKDSHYVPGRKTGELTDLGSALERQVYILCFCG